MTSTIAPNDPSDSFTVLENKRERAEEIARAGGTPADLAAEFGVSIGLADRWARAHGIRMDAARDTPEDLAIARQLTATGQPVGPRDLLGLYAGLPATVFHGAEAELQNQVIRLVHGDKPLDPRDAREGRGYCVWPGHTCRLATSLMVLSHQSVRAFSPWTLQEVARKYRVADLTVRVECRAPMDWSTGAPWGTGYLDALVARWVTGPLGQHAYRAPDLEPVWPAVERTPWRLAWWAFEQLECRGMLKGLVSVSVKRHASVPTGDQQARVTAEDRLALITALLTGQSGVQDVGRRSESNVLKFDPSILR